MDYLPWLVILQHFHTAQCAFYFISGGKKPSIGKGLILAKVLLSKLRKHFFIFSMQLQIESFFPIILTVHLLGRRAEGGHFSRGGLQEDQHQKFFSPRLLRRSHTYNIELSYLQKIS